MSRRKRARAEAPPKNQPERRDDASGTQPQSGLRVELGGAELMSALRLEIAVTGAAPAAETQPEPDLFERPAPPGEASAEAAPSMPSASPAPAQTDAVSAESLPFGDDLPESELRIEAVEPMAPVPALGVRFAEARIALGLGIEEAARQLRVPAPVLADMEAERFQALGAPVYARGFLRSYARLLKVPESALDHALASLEQAAPDLLPAVSAQPRPIAMRFATPALYALLTVLLVVPVALQLYQRSMAPSATTVVPPDRPAHEVALDAPATTSATAEQADARDAQSTAPASATVDAAPRQIPGPGSQEPRTQEPAPSHSAEPMLASLAPLPARTVTAAGQHVLLKLAESSWIELTGADGSRIEYAMLPAGTAREYSVAGRASLRIGNLRGASLFVDGKQVDLSEFARGNVARVGLGGDPAAATEAQ